MGILNFPIRCIIYFVVEKKLFHIYTSKGVGSFLTPGLNTCTILAICPGYDVKLICCCPDYDVKLIWRQQGNDIVSMAAICATTVDFLCLVVPKLLCS